MGRLNQGVIFTAVTTGIGNGTRLQVLLLGSDGHLYLIWQDVTEARVPHQDATNAMIPLLRSTGGTPDFPLGFPDLCARMSPCHRPAKRCSSHQSCRR